MDTTKTAEEYLSTIGFASGDVLEAEWCRKFMEEYAKQQVQAAIPIILEYAADKAVSNSYAAHNTHTIKSESWVHKPSILNLQHSEELNEKLGL